MNQPAALAELRDEFVEQRDGLNLDAQQLSNILESCPITFTDLHHRARRAHTQLVSALAELEQVATVAAQRLDKETTR